MAEDQEHDAEATRQGEPGPGEGATTPEHAPDAPPKPAPPEPLLEPTIHVAPSPHLSDQAFTTRRMMTDVLIGLAPLLVVALVAFGWYAVVQVGICVLSCLAAEAVFTFARRKPFSLCDGSAAVTGVILAFSLPGTAHWYVGVIGGFVAIGLGKIVFGGLGMNIFNPAMVGRAFVMMAFVKAMSTGYVLPTGNPDDFRLITQATPMGVMKREKSNPTPSPEKIRADAIEAGAGKLAKDFGMTRAEFDKRLAGTYTEIRRIVTPADIAARDAVAQLKASIAQKVADAQRKRDAHKEALDLWRLFIGNTNGSLGEISALACLVGGIFLCVRRTAAWQIPAGAVAAVVVIAGLNDILAGADMTVLHHLLGGAFLFGALFIATDPVTSPLTPKGRAIFGVLFGALVMLLRNLSAYPEGVMFAILLVNAFTPLINRWTIPTPVGGPVPQPEKKQ